MSHFAAVLDANVLYSYPLTSVLLELAEARLLRHLIDLAPNIVRSRLATMIGGFSNPEMTYEEYISLLERQSLPETAAALRELFAAE